MATVRGLVAVCLGALSLLFGAATPSAATTCIVSWTPCQAFRSPDVFVVDVLRVQQVGQRRVHRVRVLRALKGGRTGTVDVWTSPDPGPSLDVGGRYVIFTPSSAGRISLDACGPLIALAPGEPEPELPSVPGRVYGRIGRDVFLSSSAAPVVGARLWLDLPSGRRSAVSDRFGRPADRPPAFPHDLVWRQGPGVGDTSSCE